MKLTLDIDTEAGTLRTVEKTKNAQGQFDLKTHHGAVAQISPEMQAEIDKIVAPKEVIEPVENTKE